VSRTLQLRAPEATTAVLALLVSYGAFSSDEAATKEMTSRYVAQGPAATANSMLLATTEASTEAKQPNWSVSVANRLRRLRQLEAGWMAPDQFRLMRLSLKRLGDC